MEQTKGQILQEWIQETRQRATTPGEFTNYLDACCENLKECKGKITFLTDRGISKETATELKIGYDDSLGTGGEALTIPTNDAAGRCNGYILIYAADPGAAMLYTVSNGEMINSAYYEQSIYSNMGALFNTQALKHSSHETIFICLDVFDAIALKEAGAEAVAILGAANFADLKTAAEETPGNKNLIISVSKSEYDATAAAGLDSTLKELQKAACKVDLCGEYDSIRDHLQKNRPAFMDAVRHIIPPEVSYSRTTAAAGLDMYIKGIQERAKMPQIKTPFADLDAALDGGLETGLYILGAISSLGKTTFIIQLADYIAKQGHDVLFFSLEQSEREIMSKSISRETYNAAILRTGSSNAAKSTTGIMNGRKYANYTEQEKTVINDAISAYKQYAERIRIIEGVGNIGVKDIEAAVNKHVTITHNKPVIFIDYLQILAAPTDERRSYTDKQAVDKNIIELKRLSRQYTIIAVSSFNRNSYTDPVDLTSFKESGAIEYTSDVLIGLQYRGMDYKTITKEDKLHNSRKVRESDAEHAARVQTEVLDIQKERGARGEAQDIQIKILKNRNFKRGEVFLQFYPVFNMYLEERKPEAENYNPFEQLHRL